jgi:hypothetical protein
MFTINPRGQDVKSLRQVYDERSVVIPFEVIEALFKWKGL